MNAYIPYIYMYQMVSKRLLSYVINDSYNPLHNLNVKIANNEHKQVCSGKIQVQWGTSQFRIFFKCIWTTTSVNEYKQKVHLLDYFGQHIIELLESTCSARKLKVNKLYKTVQSILQMNINLQQTHLARLVNVNR